MNTYAFKAQRIDKKDELDFYPTPPWAIRIFIEKSLPAEPDDSFLEPACGKGHMLNTLKEYYKHVDGFDIQNFGYNKVQDFLDFDAENEYDWVITNPPFNKAEEFVLHGLKVCRKGVAIFARTSFIESVGRYNRLFKPFPPYCIAQYTERVPLHKGRLEKKGVTATSYAWFVWLKEVPIYQTKVVWLPPMRKQFERDSDYEE